MVPLRRAHAFGGCASLSFGAPPSSTEETLVEEETRDTMSLDEDDLPPDLEEVSDAEEEEEDCEKRDRDRHRHSELFKLGAAGAGKSGKIGVCATTRFTTSFTTSF